MAGGQDLRVGVEMSTCVCQGVGRVGCSGAALWVGKSTRRDLGNDDGFGGMSWDKGWGNDAVETPRGEKKG